MPAEAAYPSSAVSLEPAAAGSADFTRLHITPFDPELLRIIVPASVLPRARSISYHSLETFPEKRYGFVELPKMDAEKIKNKLNGSVLKGTKVRVAKARPEQVPEPTGETDKVDKKKRKSKDEPEGTKKRKRDRDVVEGVALTDRKVKRGWTEAPDYKKKKSKKEKDGKDKEKRKRIKSKYTEQEECLVKTKVPPNAIANLPDEDPSRKKKRKSKSREVTVHEFEKTTKFPSFLKDTTATTNGQSATEFVEGKGWVDDEGNVVEPVKHKTRPAAEKKASKESKPKKQPVVEDDDDTSSSGTSSEGESSDSESDEEVEPQEKAIEDQDDSDSSAEESSGSPEHKPLVSAMKTNNSRPTSSSSSKNLTIKIPPPPATPSSTKVHPLEALYKRQKSDPNEATETAAPDAQPFSFFEAEDDDEESEQPGEPVPSMPMTPFTRQDFESRTIRSAAPTPDTAHPTRMQNFWAAQDDEDEDEDDDGEEDGADGDEPAAAGKAGSSDFQAWFWENRRDLNRSWMSRRKTAAKEKRHRENKARASKAL